MNSRHLVDEELLPFLDARPPMVLNAETLPAVRAGFPEMLAMMFAGYVPPPDVAKTERMIPGPAGAPDVRVLVYTPTGGATARPAFLHIHGGGYVVGSADMSEPSCARTASEHGAVVVSVDYRLAPETPFPGPVEDCYAALTWLAANAKDLDIDPARIAIGGESAGGGLAAGLALLARDRGEVKVTHQQLIYPMIDDRPAAEMHPYTGEFIWTHASNHFGWSSLLGHEPGREGVSPYAAAARAEKLEGLPPTFISTGALDLFLEENLDYARRLTRAGVPVELHVYPGGIHGFDMAAESHLAKQHARDQRAALSRAFA